jgi:TIR domain
LPLSSVFINYRRSDAEGEAGRLFDDLTARFSDESVFMDVAGIEPGRDFRKAIDRSVATCSVLLAVIGPQWVETTNAAGERRLHDPNDFVRIELASALQRDIPVIPVLVRGAKMPHANQLPRDLQELAYRNAVELTHARWKLDLHVLLRALRPYLPPDATAGIVSASFGPTTSTASTGPTPSTTSIGPTSSPIAAEAMERVRKELAAYLGPISEVVVKRAAKRCTSLEALCGIVALEIEAEADRTRFLRACRG